MRTEISQAKKEANFYLQNVEKGKAIDAMETRKRKRADQKPVEKRLRTFKQHQAIEDTKTKKILPEKSAPKKTGKSLSKDLLRKVFTSTTGR